MIQYLITDPKYYTSNPIIFEKILSNNLKNNKVDFVCFRDKVSTNKDSLLDIFIRISRKFNIDKILINSDIVFAKRNKLDGVHLNSMQFEDIAKAKDNNLFTIISCHTEEELIKAYKYGADMATYSPIFDSPNKSKPKGCNKLSMLTKKIPLDIIALGGVVSNSQIKEVKQAGAIGFASIRYFLDMSHNFI